jgi:N-acylneuraminate cytidylyltransferase|tara:strand:- start:42 stop:707 length:666 start_codon:yes stop_codon:yes gene_type:complete
MKVVAIIPIKAKSKRVKSKNFRLLCGKPLYEFFLEKLSDHPFDELLIDTDSEEIAQYCNRNGFSIIERKPELASDSANGNDLLLYHAQIIDADIYFQLFITSPFLKEETISKAYDILTQDQDYDSLFTATKIYSWFWFVNEPVNYDPKILPRSQDAAPIIRETTALYAIRKEALLEYKCRIGQRPFMLFVDEIEAIDIDTEFDFSLAEFIFDKHASEDSEV